MSTQTQISEYTETESGLADLRQRFGSAVFDCTTTEGDKAARAARREMVLLRGKLEEMREDIKAPALERCRLVDAEAKRIKAEILNLEQPIDSQIKAEEARKEAIKAAERARLEAIQSRARNIERMAFSASGKTSEEIRGVIAELEAATEYEDLVRLAITAALESLNQELHRAINREHEQAKREAEFAERERALAAERAELERARKEQARAQAEALAVQQKAIEAQRQAQEEAAKVERAKIAAERAKADAERAEADRMAKAERDRLAAIAAEEAAKQQAIIDKQRAEIEEANRLAQIEADAKAEADRVAKEQAEAADRQIELETESSAALDSVELRRLAVLADLAAIRSEVERARIDWEEVMYLRKQLEHSFGDLRRADAEARACEVAA